MMKLFSQFEQVANATPFALREERKISFSQNLQCLRAYVLEGEGDMYRACENTLRGRRPPKVTGPPVDNQ